MSLEDVKTVCNLCPFLRVTDQSQSQSYKTTMTLQFFWVVTQCGLEGTIVLEKHTLSTFSPHSIRTQKKSTIIFTAMRTSYLTT
jgi:hypothetical protein